MSEPRNTIRSWALVAVAVSSIFTIGIAIWLISILSGQDWCSRALGAAKYAEGRPQPAIDACFSLMDQQIKTLGWALLIVIGVQALSLLTLVVIVIAGGRLNLRGSKDGIDLDIGREPDPKIEAAKRVEAAARDERKTIEEEVEAEPAKPTGDTFEQDTA